MKDAPGRFTHEEWTRPNGTQIGDMPGGGFAIWNSRTLGWDMYSTEHRYLGVVYPDHERRRTDPEFAPIYEKLERRFRR